MEVLTQTSFDSLLAALDADRERAGVKYEQLRSRLVKFFEWRNCEVSDELADQCIDRVLKKIAEGERIQNIFAYAATVAQFVLKEHFRNPSHKTQSIDETPELGEARDVDTLVNENDDARLNCLQKCLAQFSDENRRLVTAYYDTDEATMIAARRRLADSLQVSLNTLRIRVCRLKSKLEDCTKDCCRLAG